MQGRAWTCLLALAVSMFALAPNARAQNAADGYAPAVYGATYAVVVQPDGKALIGGSFIKVNDQSCHYVCRLLADGSVDPAFVDPGLDGDVHALAVQPDGKLLIGGAFTSIGGQPHRAVARLNTNGSLDATFTDPGVDNSIYALAVQPDGKLVVGGIFTQIGPQARPYLARLNANGSFDTSFADPGVDDSVFSLAMQPDGKLLLGGYFTQVGGQSRRNVARLNANGSLDATYADPGGDYGVFALALQPDGKLLVGGNFSSIGGQTRRCLARLDANGAVDANFVDPGMSNCSVSALAMQPGGKLSAGGIFRLTSTSELTGLARLGVDGGLDATFSPDVDGSVSALALQADGKLLLAGGFSSIGGQPRDGFARLNASGNLDTDFADSGTNDYVYALAAQADDKVLVGGSFTSIGGQARGGVTRLLSNGTVDQGFASLQMLGGDVFSVNPRSDDKLLVGGSFMQVREELLSGNAYTYDLHGLALLDRVDGKPETGFDPKINGTVYAVDTLTLDRMLIGGDFTSVGGATRGHVARLKSDGSLDTTFANPAVQGTVMSLVELPDGKVLIGGPFTGIGPRPRGGVPYHGVARLNSDGSLDDKDGKGGFIDPMVMGAGGLYDSVMALAVLPSGRIVIGGGFDTVGGQPRKGLAILNKDGSLAERTGDLQPDGMVTSLAVQADGKILVSGDFTSIGGYTYHGIARLNATGSVDTTFVDPGADGAVYAVAMQADGKLLAGGGFTVIGGQPRSRVARLSLPEAALQSVYVQGNTVTWYRGGTASELSTPPIMSLYLNTSLFAHGPMTHIDGGWQYVLSQPLPLGRFLNLSVGGHSAGGAHNASHGPVESTLRLWSGDDVIFADGFELETPP
jgi:uncharacterized delta-60 repeat protein